MTFTAAQVRQAIKDSPESEFGCNTCGGTSDQIAMLRAYADRLEQDEQHAGLGIVVERLTREEYARRWPLTAARMARLGSDNGPPHDEAADMPGESLCPCYWCQGQNDAREEGRREVLAEVAKLSLSLVQFNTVIGCYVCACCNAEGDQAYGSPVHEADCLYIRAKQSIKQATQEPVTP